MTKSLWKLALQTTAPFLCGLILLNAYLVTRNLRSIEQSAGLRAGASEIQAAISNVAFDLQTMETSQRGYLLTGDLSYLRPYNEANERLTIHFGDLRSRITEKDRSLGAQIESLAQAKIAEMQETIRLRQLGYRHRAFLIVDSNHGQRLMESARTALDALSSAQTRNVARHETELKESVRRAVRQSAYANLILLVVALATFLAFNWYRNRLELGYAQHDEELRTTSLQLARLTSTVFRDVRVLLGEFQNDAQALLGAYGGFLPRQAHEKVRRIEDEAGRMICLLDDLSKAAPGNSGPGVAMARVQSLSA